MFSITKQVEELMKGKNYDLVTDNRSTRCDGVELSALGAMY